MNAILQNKKNNHLIVFTAFVVLWWSFGCFQFVYNGFFQKILGGRLGLIIFVLYVISYFIAKSRCTSMFNNVNKTDAIWFLLLNICIYFISLIVGGSFIPGDFVIMAFVGWAILTLNVESRIKVFDVFLYATISILTVSLIEFFIFAITGKGIVIGITERKLMTSGNSQTFIQTLFNIIDINQDIPRFQSLYEESGSVGNVAILLLFLTGNKPRYRFAHIISWIAGIVSFSLGFYLLAVVYVLGQNIKFWNLLLFAIVLAIFVRLPFLMERYDVLIQNRVQDRSIEEIDDRTNDVLDAALDNSFHDGTIWFGHGGVLPAYIQYESGVSGGKPFVYKYGIVMTLFTLLFYIMAFLKTSSAYKMSYRKRLLFVIFFILSFYKSAVLFQSYFVLMYFLYPHIEGLSDINNNVFNSDSDKIIELEKA